MKDSAIEWTDHTFNMWEGCTKVSPGCTNCYAEARNNRFHAGANWGKGAPRLLRSAQYRKEPLKWNRDARQSLVARRPRVFCASLSDWLDDEVPIEWLADLLKLIHDTPNLDWLLLTKRPENWESRLCKTGETVFSKGTNWVCDWLDGKAPANVWIGTTVEDQQRADERIPALLKIPARVRFLSCEPLLEAVDLHFPTREKTDYTYAIPDNATQHLDWVICGGESGPKKRPFNPDWARSLRDQCAAAGVSFFMKQWDKVQPVPADLLIRHFPTPNGGTGE